MNSQERAIFEIPAERTSNVQRSTSNIEVGTAGFTNLVPWNHFHNKPTSMPHDEAHHPQGVEA